MIGTYESQKFTGCTILSKIAHIKIFKRSGAQPYTFSGWRRWIAAVQIMDKYFTLAARRMRSSPNECNLDLHLTREVSRSGSGVTEGEKKPNGKVNLSSRLATRATLSLRRRAGSRSDSPPDCHSLRVVTFRYPQERASN